MGRHFETGIATSETALIHHKSSPVTPVCQFSVKCVLCLCSAIAKPHNSADFTFLWHHMFGQILMFILGLELRHSCWVELRRNSKSSTINGQHWRCPRQKKCSVVCTRDLWTGRLQHIFVFFYSCTSAAASK